MPPDEKIHQENHFSQDAERLNSLDLNCVKKKIYFKSLFGGSASSIQCLFILSRENKLN